MFDFSFHKSLFLKIVLAFILFTIIGTQTHEFGHIFVAKFLGYETNLHYGSMNYNPKGYLQDSLVIEYKELHSRYIDDYSKMSPVDKEKVRFLSKAISNKYPIPKSHKLWISIGGPLQTFLTSFLGLFLLKYFNSKNRSSFRKRDWFAVFLSLFALREVFNFVMALPKLFIDKQNYFNGDEFKISLLLGYNQWFIPTIAMIVGLLISIYVVFKVTPQKYRFTFIVAGFIGGGLGFVFWFKYLGKLLLP